MRLAFARGAAVEGPRPGRAVEGRHTFGLLLLEQLLRVLPPDQWPRPYKPHRVLASWVVPAAAVLLGVDEKRLLKDRWEDVMERLESLQVSAEDPGSRLQQAARWLRQIVGEAGGPGVTLGQVLSRLEGRARYSGEDRLARKYLELFRKVGFDGAWRRALEELASQGNAEPELELICAGLPPGFFTVVGAVRRLNGGQMLLQDDFRVFYAVVTNCRERGYGRTWEVPLPAVLAERVRAEEYRGVRLGLSRDFPETVELLDRWMEQWIRTGMDVTVEELLGYRPFVLTVKDLAGWVRERVVDGLREAAEPERGEQR
jgi:hypothetical protein